MAELTKITRTLCFALGVYLLTSFSGGFTVSAQSVENNSNSTDSLTFFQRINNSRFISNFPAFALKTNMLYDAATILNIKVEAPIIPCLSVGLEWIFPWWHNRNVTYALEAGIGDGEVRYWFQDRSQKGMLEGWFAGVYGAGGYYDIQDKTKGNQGELYSVGLTGGYAMPIAKLLKLEFCLGAGYMHTDYRHYTIKRDSQDYQKTSLIYQYTAKTDWWGPTKAEVSLVFTISSKNYNRKGR